MGGFEPTTFNLKVQGSDPLITALLDYPVHQQVFSFSKLINLIFSETRSNYLLCERT